MLDADDRIGKLGQTIISDAEQTAADIIKQAEQKAAQITGEAKKRFQDDEQRQIEADKLKTETLYAKEMSSRDFAAKKQVLAYRSELVEELFCFVQEKLSEYVATPDYSKLLTKLCEKANSEQPIDQSCTIYLSAEDMKYSQQLAQSFGAKTEKNNSINIGGVLVYYPKSNIFIDYTLDTTLEKQKTLFVNKKELAL